MDTSITLDKIDAVRERTGGSYATCYAALEKAAGDVVQAIVAVEKRHDWRRRVGEKRGAVISRLRDIAQETNRTKISVRHGERTVVEVPGLIGALGTALMPAVAAAGVLAAFFTHSSISFERRV